ncbi:MAG TPA: NADP-dependent phosphogluconate dehydrogenase [Lunatimonas sp.]|nr:NADP-dependent phosphogluconate dehydrogenase [Lunatimonas sp.]
MVIIVYGVTGCGKSTVGQLLAEKLNFPFYDGDNFHPISNVEKMRKGIPLTDEDRIPWLNNLRSNIQTWERNGGAVLACSALNEKYRKILKRGSNPIWVLLDGSKELIQERLDARIGHFMNPALLESQFATLEKPTYGVKVPIDKSPAEIVEQIYLLLKNMNELSSFGVIGMGVMGKSLALNLSNNGVSLSIYNRHVPNKEERVAAKVLEQFPDQKNFLAFDDLPSFVNSLSSPRKILLMIPAGQAVDHQIEELIPLLSPGDIIIDGGNSYYKDTNRRVGYLEEKELLFVGTGVSGGEEGALKGPSIMPSGPKEAVDKVLSLFEKIAAKDKSGKPCTAYIGPEGSGHFIKMVHNSIEYAEMQALTEVYFLMRRHLGMNPKEIYEVLTTWREGETSSYLLEITCDILNTYEGDGLLLDKILDKAAQKGTGGWSVTTALEYGVPYGVLSEAVMARAISFKKAERIKASQVYGHKPKAIYGDRSDFLDSMKEAYQACRIINHEVGFGLMKAVSDEHKWDLNFSEIARIWTNGCIIRSSLMESAVAWFSTSDNLLMHTAVIDRMKLSHQKLAFVVGEGIKHGLALPVFSAAINYFLGAITAESPANLIQAQRDYFGAHTYERVDAPGGKHFHTDWKE